MRLGLARGFEEGGELGLQEGEVAHRLCRTLPWPARYEAITRSIARARVRTFVSKSRVSGIATYRAGLPRAGGRVRATGASSTLRKVLPRSVR